jgi:hypothetical protein
MTDLGIFHKGTSFAFSRVKTLSYHMKNVLFQANIVGLDPAKIAGPLETAFQA